VKIYIKAGPEGFVRVYDDLDNAEEVNFDFAHVCRGVMSRLLRGTGKHLPRHYSNKIVEVELTAK